MHGDQACARSPEADSRVHSIALHRTPFRWQTDKDINGSGKTTTSKEHKQDSGDRMAFPTVCWSKLQSHMLRRKLTQPPRLTAFTKCNSTRIADSRVQWKTMKPLEDSTGVKQVPSGWRWLSDPDIYSEELKTNICTEICTWLCIPAHMGIYSSRIHTTRTGEQPKCLGCRDEHTNITQ